MHAEGFANFLSSFCTAQNPSTWNEFIIEDGELEMVELYDDILALETTIMDTQSTQIVPEGRVVFIK